MYLNRWIEDRCRITTEDEPKSPLGRALRYANQQWPKRIKILDYENTELDNKLIEKKSDLLLWIGKMICLRDPMMPHSESG
ncbi:MAG: transposase [Saprospiraceae bacterium]|nr:transposase [Saprospiraceae bacterium]